MRANQCSAAGMSELVTFFIGPSKIKFLIHKRIVCEASPVFEAAFNSSFIEGQAQEYVLADTTEGTFALFTEWIYRGDFNVSLPNDVINLNLEDLHSNLLDLWILADKLLIPRLQNRALQLLDDTRKKFKQIYITKYISVWSNTGDDCVLRRYLLDLLVRWAHSDTFKEQQESLSMDILVDAATLFAEILDSGVKRLPLPAVETYYVKEDAN